MARFLCLGLTASGGLAAAMVNDSTGANLPYGDHGAILSKFDGVDELTAIVEMPEGDFRPEVVDPVQDGEAGMVFIDL